MASSSSSSSQSRPVMSTGCCSGGSCGGDVTRELNVDAASSVYSSVQQYYGQTLQKKDDLQYSACTATGPVHPIVREAMKRVPNEVMEKFYGCGNPVPLGIHGLTVLDLGSGSGRDCYVCAQLVGEHGQVIGVDMTDEQLAVARAAVQPFTATMGYKAPNVRFLKGFIENIAAAGVAPGSVDVVISNCVVNLSPDKPAVLKGVYAALRAGGEFHFSDVYSDRRVPEAARRSELLYGECIAGALYTHDFLQLCRATGFADPRVLSIRPLPLPDRLKGLLGGTNFYSITFRLFKVANLEPNAEDYHQSATYNGTINGFPESYELDDKHVFVKGKTVPISGNTATILSGSWLAKHFTVHGDRSVHYGAMPNSAAELVLPPMPSNLTAAGGGCCGTGSASGCCGPKPAAAQPAPTQSCCSGGSCCGPTPSAQPAPAPTESCCSGGSCCGDSQH